MRNLFYVLSLMTVLCGSQVYADNGDPWYGWTGAIRKLYKLADQPDITDTCPVKGGTWCVRTKKTNRNVAHRHLDDSNFTSAQKAQLDQAYELPLIPPPPPAIPNWSRLESANAKFNCHAFAVMLTPRTDVCIQNGLYGVSRILGDDFDAFTGAAQEGDVISSALIGYDNTHTRKVVANESPTTATIQEKDGGFGTYQRTNFDTSQLGLAKHRRKP